MHVVYIIQNSSTSDLYVGQTNNFTRRLQQHNQGSNYSTHRKDGDGNWILVCAEAYRAKEDAMKREAKLKQRGSAKHGVLKRLHNSLLQAQR